MEYFGNKTWNNATDNNDKAVVALREDSFQRILPLLEQSGLNFYAYVKDGTAALAINASDADKVKRMLGDQGKALQFRRSARPYSPPQKNIIGNVAYRYIPDKQYISLDRDTALKVAEQLEKANISFSGVIYSSGKATLTVGGADLARAEAIKQSVMDMRRQLVSDKQAEQIIGNKPYRDIRNKRVLFTGITPEQYEGIRGFLDARFEYSGLIRGGKVMFTVEADNAPAFEAALQTGLRLDELVSQLMDKGFTEDQVVSMRELISKAVSRDEGYYLTEYFNPHYTPEQFEQMKAVMGRFLDETETERFRDTSAMAELHDLKQQFHRLAELEAIYALHPYSEEQKAVIAEIYSDSFPAALFETVDESYTLDEMRELADIIRHFTGYDDVERFLAGHQKRMEISEENVEIFKALKEHKPVYLHRENAPEGYEFRNERIEYYEGYGFAVLGDTNKDSDLVHQHFYTRSAEEAVIDFIQNGTLAQDGYVVDGLTAPAREEQTAEIVPETPELTEKEQSFLDSNIAALLAKEPLAWDEIENMGDWLFRKGYTEKHSPSEKAHYGYNLPETALYDLAIRFHNGEDIRAELAKAVLGTHITYSLNTWDEFTLTHGEDTMTAHFGNAEREVSYAEIGGAMLDLIQKEHDEIVHDSTIDCLMDDVKGIDKETAEKVLTAFDNNTMHGWDTENDPAKINRIKRAIYEVLGDDEQTEAAFASIARWKYGVKFEQPVKKESSLHFGLLGNGITVYDVSRTDPETHDYPTVAHISPEGVITMREEVSAEDMERIREQAQSARDEFMSDWSKLSTIAPFQRLVDNADMATLSNIHKEKLPTEEIIAKYMPFVFLQEGERPEPEQEQSKITYKLFQLPDGEQYHGIRFEGMEQLKRDGVQLNHEDYALVYEGELTEFKGDTTLESLFSRFNSDHPADFTGRSFSVSDVMVISENGKDTAYYCDMAGFVEMPDFFKEKELENEKLTTLQDVVDAYFGTDCESAETENGTWKLAIADGDKVGELFYDGEAVCGIYNRGDKMEIEPYRELSTFPKLLQTAMLEHNPDKLVEIMEFQRTMDEQEQDEPVKLHEIVIDLNPQNTVRFDRDEPETESSLDRAKNLINDFCVSEYSTEADFSDLSHVDLAYTTDEETMLPIQVYADLEAFRIVKEYDGKEVAADTFGSLEAMLPALESLDFGDLVYLADEEKGITQEETAPAVDDEDTPLFSAEALQELDESTSDTDRSFTPFADDDPGEQLTLFGDSEPLASEKPKKKAEQEQYETGLIVGGVNRFAALHDDLMRGTGFENGKFTVLEYYTEHKPTNKEFADFLKKHYGIGGHSGDDKIGYVDHDARGIVFRLETGEKFKFTWSEIAQQLSEMIDKDEYITPEDIAERQRYAKFVVEHTNPDTTLEYERMQLETAKKILAEYGIEASFRTEIAEPAPEIEKPQKAINAQNIEVGDTFLYNGKEYTVESMQGVYPDDVGVSHAETMSNGTQYTSTENIDRHKLISEGEYLGNPGKGIVPLVPSDAPSVQKTEEVKAPAENADPARFTSLSDEQNAYFADYPPTPIPEMSPWGEVQECTIIAKGVFEVSTPGHGGIMIREDLAEHILSDEALQIGFAEDGFLCFEEDADAQVALRELLDKGIMDKEQYFSDKYRSTYEEKGEWFNSVINSSITHNHADYWTAHEHAADRPFVEEIAGINDTVKYRISENADDKYKYNVQVLTMDANGEFVYSGNGRYCETLDEARAFVQQDLNDRAEKEIAEAIGLPKERKMPSNTIAHRNFVNLQKLYPEIFSGEHTYEKHKGKDESGYEDFSIVRHGDRLTLMHTFEQNGDKMYDPRIEYRIDMENQTLHAINYEMSSLGIYQEYEDGSRGQRDTDSFTQTWVKNLRDQERYLAIADVVFEFEDDVHDIEIYYDENGNITEINGEDDVVAAFKAAKGIGEAHAEQTVPPVTAEQDAPVSSDNFKITDETLGEGGQKTKFQANIAAIRTLKQIEAENRPATPEEQEVLSRYVGWGGLAPAFEENNPAWEAEHKILTELLTDEEYRSARASTLDAFYTTPLVIDGIYEALSNFGFEGGNVLEPACGIGNFFGRMSEELRKDSHLYGVEIDSLSGRIAQALYPTAEITINGFEKNEFQNGSFDVVVGNVPFGYLGFKDEKHGTTQLHDYFFAESLDKVKPGGVIALVTSAGTLDKQNEATRAMLAQQADLIGAVRLPSTAFKGNANTEVTTDIIFLQKRSEPPAELPDWVHIGETENGLPINKYYEQHPEMVLGEVVEGNKLYAKQNGTMVVPFEGADLKEQLHEAVSKLSAEISDERPRNVYAKAEQGEIPVPNNLRNYSFFEHDDKIYFKTADRICSFRFDETNKQHRRAKAFIELRDTVRELLTAQEYDKPDSEIKALQEKLNTVYDDFYKKFGLLHSRTNKLLFSEDVSYNLVLSLEKEIDRDKLVAKSDLFSKRTIRPPKPVEHVETAMEALTLSTAEKACVDFDYMSELTGFTEAELKQQLEGEIFKVPHNLNTYQTKSEYLSGDIRKKLNEAQEAAEYDSDFNINVTALKEAMPPPLKAGDIDVKIGATWIDPAIYQQFLYEMLQTPDNLREGAGGNPFRKSSLVTVSYSDKTNMFHIENKRSDLSVNATKTYGTRKMNAYEIMEHLLNLKEPKIYKTVEAVDQFGNPTEKRVVDPEATRVVQKKADKIRSEFKKWIFKDPKRREMLVDRYNELFNSIRPREYDGSALTFPMMNSDIELHEHQKNAIAHALFGGNTLFAHSVGAGKTFEMIATAMESKRLGLCTKSLFAVPNHLTEQIGQDFRRLYPSANILVATKNDFKKENRQQLFAKIATGNFDAIIIGHSQLGMIPISKERQIMQIQEQIADVLSGIAELKQQEGSKFQIKQMERTRKSLQKQLDKLEKSHDDTLTFEQLGVDKLFVDEAHEFKNLFCPTKLANLSGVSTSASQKAFDLFMKCRYLDEKTGGRGLCFATGTPLSNSVTELHTMMRYLEYDFLASRNLQNFDNWITVITHPKGQPFIADKFPRCSAEVRGFCCLRGAC